MVAATSMATQCLKYGWYNSGWIFRFVCFVLVLISLNSQHVASGYHVGRVQIQNISIIIESFIGQLCLRVLTSSTKSNLAH